MSGPRRGLRAAIWSRVFLANISPPIPLSNGLLPYVAREIYGHHNQTGTWLSVGELFAVGSLVFRLGSL